MKTRNILSPLRKKLSLFGKFFKWLFLIGIPIVGFVWSYFQYEKRAGLFERPTTRGVLISYENFLEIIQFSIVGAASVCFLIGLFIVLYLQSRWSKERKEFQFRQKRRK